MNRLSTKVIKGLSGPDLVSVRYVPTFRRSCGEAPGYYPAFVVTVDLRTGRALTPEDVFKPSSFTKAGMMRLWDAIPDGEDKQRLALGYSGSGGFFNPFDRESFHKTDRRPESPAWAAPFFGAKRFNLLYAGQALGMPSPGNRVGRLSAYSFPIPYRQVKGLFKPEFAALLPAS